MVVGCSLMSLPLYVNKRGGMFHFRMRIPEDIQGILSIREISRALKTSNPREAFRKAQRLAWVMTVFYDDVREGKFMSMKDKEIKALVAEWLEETLEEDRLKRITRGKPKTDEEVDDDVETYSYLESDLRENLATGNIKAVEAIAREILEDKGLSLDKGSVDYKTLCHELLVASVTCMKALQDRNLGKTEGYQQYLSSIVVSKPEEEELEAGKNNPLLSELIDEWVKDKMRLKDWNERTKEQNVPMVEDFVEMVGDMPIARLKPEHMRDARERFMRVPKNRKQTKDYADKSLRELSELEIPEEGRMNPQTLSNRAVKIGGFLKWVKDRGYPVRNDLETVMKFKQNKRKASTARAVFTQDELTRMFCPDNYLEAVKDIPSRFWVPLIGLCTGMRIEEICQLYLVDIKEENGVLCFDVNTRKVNGKNDKSVKTLSGNRLVPVSPVLKDLGIVEYIEELREKGAERLFPELVKKKNSSKYSSEVSRWFNRYLDNIGIENDEEKGSKVFHSFRHTFINDCKQAGVENLKRREVAGHAGNRDVEGEVYDKPYTPDILYRDVIMKVLPKVDLSKLKEISREQ